MLTDPKLRASKVFWLRVPSAVARRRHRNLQAFFLPALLANTQTAQAASSQGMVTRTNTTRNFVESYKALPKRLSSSNNHEGEDGWDPS